MPITAREWALPNGVPLHEVPPLAPNAADDQVTRVVFGSTVEPNREG